jgi:hypothetical protein
MITIATIRASRIYQMNKRNDTTDIDSEFCGKWSQTIVMYTDIARNIVTENPVLSPEFLGRTKTMGLRKATINTGINIFSKMNNGRLLNVNSIWNLPPDEVIFFCRSAHVLCSTCAVESEILLSTKLGYIFIGKSESPITLSSI